MHITYACRHATGAGLQAQGGGEAGEDVERTEEMDGLGQFTAALVVDAFILRRFHAQLERVKVHVDLNKYRIYTT